MALAVFLMHWVVIVGGRRDITPCGMRQQCHSRQSASAFLETPAAQLHCGKVGGEQGG